MVYLGLPLNSMVIFHGYVINNQIVQENSLMGSQPTKITKQVWSGMIPLVYMYSVGLSLMLHVPSGNLTVCYWKWPSRNSGFSH